MREQCRAALSADGALSVALQGFQPRDEQQAMADAVAETVETGGTLIAEAGTGTGKTLAYLVPALLSGRKVIVSTGTRTLQDQLYHRDLPLVSKALESRVRTALLKGRSNYLCLYRMEMTADEGRFDSREQAASFQRIRDWSTHTRSGDLAEAPVTLGDPALTSRVSSTADNCLGQECPLYGECYLMEARRRAQEADVLVVNHHLLMADWAVRAGGYGEVLPAADVYILDEAHQLPDTAAQFFGLSVSARQLFELARDARLEQLREAGDSPQVGEAAQRLHRATLDLRLALGNGTRRAPWTTVATERTVGDALAGLVGALDTLHETLEPQAQRAKGLESCWRRAAELRQTLAQFLEGDAERYVQWFETYSQSFMLRLTPLDIAETFSGNMERHPGTWVFTSATLTVGGSFRHFAERLGLSDPRTVRVESPFDYEHNALLYLPAGMPPPNAPDFLDRFLDRAERVVKASGGRAFLLFTSHRALQIAARRLAGRIPYPLLVQGEAGQNRLLKRFREAGDAVLLGTQSFWEGVDVRGEALSCVIIDKLPFASPSDPVTRARIDALRRRNANPFVDFQLPQAVITLRQGVGRLIRDAGDRGVLMLGDSRLTTRAYGRVFLDSLPAMPVTRDVEDVERFFAGPGDAARAE
ncbi:MAG TPA: ATP-dependent DNA helicase [Gammaproteobacteria bacterium]|nr:ATP-dependent DNA helicase [Gammaproteobacteria bacterium]